MFWNVLYELGSLATGLSADIVLKYELIYSSSNKSNAAISVNVGLGNQYTVAHKPAVLGNST